MADGGRIEDVYRERMGGGQPGLVGQGDWGGSAAQKTARTPRPAPLPSRLTDAEREAHDAFIASLGGEPLWLAQKEN